MTRSSDNLEKVAQASRLQPDGTSLQLTITQRHLPHWFLGDSIYFITFRLADSMPQSVLVRWKGEQEEWLRSHPEPHTEDVKNEFRELFNEKREAWLDAGHGDCVLRSPGVSAMVADAVAYFDGDRYDLGDYVVMPNHVHLLVSPRPCHQLSEILHSWKSFTSKEINRRLGRKGTLWQDESYDHIVRSEAQLAHYQRYIADNPVKARLREGEYRLGSGGMRVWGDAAAGETPAPHCEAPAGKSDVRRCDATAGETPALHIAASDDDDGPLIK